MNKTVSKSSSFKNSLIYEIETGVYRQLEKLPSEREMSVRYGISRTTIRQAMEELQEGNIVQRRPSVGAFVAKNALEALNEYQSSHIALSAVLVMPLDMVDNPLLQSIYMTCRRYMNKRIKLSVIFDDLQLTSLLHDIKADVIILYSYADDEKLKILKKQVDSLILLNRQHEDCNYISADNFGGGKLMAEHVISAGHRAVGCIGPSGNGVKCDFNQRFLGIQKVCEEAGVQLENYTLSMENYFNLSASCHLAMDNILLRKPDITAMLGLYDVIALGICNSLRLRRISIPEDMSIVGFDDHFFTQYTEPSLSTVKYPAESIGVKLAEFIENINKGQHVSMQENIIPLLIDRKSVMLIK